MKRARGVVNGATGDGAARGGGSSGRSGELTAKPTEPTDSSPSPPDGPSGGASAPGRTSRGWMRWAKLAFNLIVFALVVAGIGHTVRKSLDQFRAHSFSLAELDLKWLTLAGALYLVGSLPGWWFWHRVIEAMGQHPRKWDSLRAFYIGHLGKYVPGKAMVVILRAVLVRSPQVDTAIAGAAVFVETLTTMAVGAIVGGVLAILLYRDEPRLVLLAVLLLFGAGIPALPPVFRRVVLVLRIHKASPLIEPALAGLRFPLMSRGWATIAASWLLLGLSLWATLLAMPQRKPDAPLADVVQMLPLMTTCTALAMVAGFVSMIPGGVGVRELVVMTLLAPVFGEATAVVSAILLRFVWLIAELVMSAILYLVPRRPPS